MNKVAFLIGKIKDTKTATNNYFTSYSKPFKVDNFIINETVLSHYSIEYCGSVKP